MKNTERNTKEKFKTLREYLIRLDKVMVAYSGGTDSAFLSYVAHEVLGTNVLAVIADSPSLPRKELSRAIAFAAHHGIPLKVVQTNEVDNDEYRRNDHQRCFHCKDELFTQMRSLKDRLGFEHLAYGMNLDDLGDFRPGQRAAELHGALAPLAMAQLSKEEIRLLARDAGLEIAEKPASACLASRVEYGREVTVEVLDQIEASEDGLHQLGFRRIRVRHHGDLARVEIAIEELPRAFDLMMFERITQVLRSAGYRYTSIDTEGYRSGAMNEILKVTDITPAK
jgi:uncharacterized protein